jgi:hypothetical protein
MDAVRYPFINTGQEKRLLKALWKCVEKPNGTEGTKRDSRVMEALFVSRVGMER